MTTFNQPPRWDERSTPHPSWQAAGSQVPHRFDAPTPTTNDERLFATLAHLSAPVAWIVSAGWLNFVGPLVLWLLFRDRSPFTRRAASGAFNFTLSMTVLGVVGWLMVFTIILLPVGVLLIALSGLATIVLGIVGALKTWGGVSYRYPWQLRVLS